jgi:DNA-binding transcriptional LysR family regulator
MCDAAAAGMGVALVRLKLGRPWLDAGTLVRLSERHVPSPHAHYLCCAPARWTAGNARPLPSGAQVPAVNRPRPPAPRFSHRAERNFMPGGADLT